MFHAGPPSIAVMARTFTTPELAAENLEIVITRRLGNFYAAVRRTDDQWIAIPSGAGFGGLTTVRVNRGSIVGHGASAPYATINAALRRARDVARVCIGYQRQLDAIEDAADAAAPLS